MSEVVDVLDRARLATVTGGWDVKEWTRDLKEMTVINAGQYGAGVGCFAGTSIPLHGKFFVPPQFSWSWKSWKTLMPYAAATVCSAGTGATLKQMLH